MRKRKIKRQFKNFRIYKELYEKPLKHDWVGRVVFLIQILLFFAGGCNNIAASGIYGLKFLGHLILIIMLIQLVLANVFQSTLFSCLPKVDQVINSGIN